MSLNFRHNAYEGLWLFTKGPQKIANYITGKEKFEFDPSILFEGYSHDRGTKRLGSNEHRDTTAIDNDSNRNNTDIDNDSNCNDNDNDS